MASVCGDCYAHAGRIRNDDDDDDDDDAHVAVPLRSHPCRCGRGAAVT